MSDPQSHPLRLAYVRLIQAALAIHLTMLDIDPELGGGPHLEEVLLDISTAKTKIERIAVAEGIALANEDDE